MKKKNLLKLADNSISNISPININLEFQIVLVEPSGSANIGFVARNMKNFGFKHLILFNPQCEIDSDSRKYAMHARKDVLEKAQIIHLNKEKEITREFYLKKFKKFLEQFDFVIGTSGKVSTFRNIKRMPYLVDELDISSLTPSEKTKIGLIFGRESIGLYNEEIDLCDILLRIPTSDDYTALNLSHAVSIVLFTIFKKIRVIRKGNVITSTREQRETLYSRIWEVLSKLEFKKNVDKNIVRTFKNILGRAFSSMKEVNLLLSLFLRIEGFIRRTHEN